MKECAIPISRAAQGCSWCFWLCLGVLLASCQETHQAELLFEARFGTEPPTTVLVERLEDAWCVRNGAERIVLPSVASEVYRVPVFGGSWSGGWEGEIWRGHWTDSLRPNNYRVELTLTPLTDPLNVERDEELRTSYWSTTEGVLILKQRGDSAWATITTPTGDYRYLAGIFRGKTLVFNNFDGSHLFRFQADLQADSLIRGEFLSGTHYRTSFSGTRLPDDFTSWTSSTQQPTSRELQFDGVTTSGESARWTLNTLEQLGKTGLVLDIMGTWCPNCMDEARLLRELSPDYPELQFLSLAFERGEGEAALARLRAFQNEMQLPWEVWLGGRASKAVAASVLSALDTVHSFPTTVFWPLNGEPTIHKGFNGPATGEGYEVERAYFRSEMARISGRSENR